MAGVTIDITVANRFMSSLSKSLQALCHGCMEFDSGIEIVGYINVNIDSGSKMDYVLNEKVHKSKDNAMTFVSNSFFAKKEKEKQLRDGTCSPVPELNSDSYETSSPNNSYSSQSYHSQIFHGAQKRHYGSREKDRRISHRKYPKFSRPDYGSKFTPTSFSTHPQPSHTHSSSQSSHMPSSSMFQSESSSPNSSNTCGTVCVKEEPTEHELSSGQKDFTEPGDNGYTEDQVHVKPEPNSQDTVNDESLRTHFSEDHFQQHSKTPQQQSSSNNPGFGSRSDNTVAEDNPLNEFSESYENNDFENSGTIPTSADSYHTDEGQPSGDFECIEIDDDEEEQFQAFFGDNQINSYAHQSFEGSSAITEQMQSDCFRCQNCYMEFYSEIMLQKHISHNHSQELPYPCQSCSRGFFSKSGLLRHIKATHEGRRFVCDICDSQFKAKYDLMSHMRSRHKLKSLPPIRAKKI